MAVDREQPEEQAVVEVTRDLRGLLSPVISLRSFDELYPEVLGNEYDETAFARAETAEQALQVLEANWGPEGLEMILGEEWREMAPELLERWMRPEPMEEDSPYYREAVEDGDPCPLWWRPVAEGTPGAVRYWMFDP